MIDMGSLGGDFGFVVALNNHGEAVGFDLLADDVAQHPFLWSNGAMHDLGTLGGTVGEADAINDSGEVVGSAYFPGDAVRHALLWRNGNMRDLGVLPGDICSAAWSINSQGQIVGNSGQCGFGIRSFIWENGEIANLNDLVTPKSDVVLNDVSMIADNGEIAVNGLPPGCDDGDVCGHPYLLIPIGDCDNELSAKITAQQTIRSVGIQGTLSLSPARVDPIQTPLDRFRHAMRNDPQGARHTD
jgi:probable HAF family extracellular repeat protein